MILDRRLVFVSGKGGVGKSTVARALARAGVRCGRRVLLAEERADTPAGLEVPCTTISGAAALDEYLGRALPRPLARLVTGSRAYRGFVGAAPGLRELMALGKVADLARRGEADLVVVDSPATGHVVEILRMPGVAAGLFGGLVRAEAERLASELRDPGHSAFVLVALAEELVVRETLELARALAALGLPVLPIVVNCVRWAPLGPEAWRAPPAGAAGMVAAALRCGREEAVRAAAQVRELARLDAAAGGHVELPYLFAADLGVGELDQLGERLVSALAVPAVEAA